MYLPFSRICKILCALQEGETAGLGPTLMQEAILKYRAGQAFFTKYRV